MRWISSPSGIRGSCCVSAATPRPPGLTLREPDFEFFRAAFEETVRSLVTAADLERHLETDGSLAPEEATLDFATAIADAVWGQGFPEPCFCDAFEVVRQRVVGGAHMKLSLTRGGRAFEAMLFGAADDVPQKIEAVYRLDVNDYGGTRALQLTLHHWRPHP